MNFDSMIKKLSISITYAFTQYSPTKFFTGRWAFWLKSVRSLVISAIISHLLHCCGLSFAIIPFRMPSIFWLHVVAWMNFVKNGTTKSALLAQQITADKAHTISHARFILARGSAKDWNAFIQFAIVLFIGRNKHTCLRRKTSRWCWMKNSTDSRYIVDVVVVICVVAFSFRTPSLFWFSSLSAETSIIRERASVCVLLCTSHCLAVFSLKQIGVGCSTNRKPTPDDNEWILMPFIIKYK